MFSRFCWLWEKGSWGWSVKNQPAKLARLKVCPDMSPPPPVVDPVAAVQVHVLEDVEDRQDLPVVRDQRLAHVVS